MQLIGRRRYAPQKTGLHTHHLGHTKNDNIGVLCEGDLNRMEKEWWVNSKQTSITINLPHWSPHGQAASFHTLPQRRASLRGPAKGTHCPPFDARQSNASAFGMHPGPHLPILTGTPSRQNCVLLPIKSPKATCFRLRYLQTSNLLLFPKTLR